MLHPLVTAVITTFRRPELLLRAVESIGSEIYPAIELVVVEDGCELDADFLKSTGSESRLIQHQGDTRLGVAGARNLGLEYARGEYIIYLDDDDVVESHRISTLVELAGSRNADICYGATRKHLPGSTGEWYPIPTYPQESTAITFTDMLICMPHVNSMLVRVDALKQVGGFDSRTPNFDEWSPLLKILDEGGTGFFTDTIVADWFVHDRGLTGQVQREHSMKQDIEHLLEVIRGEVSPANRVLVDRVRDAVSETAIETYDDYADCVAKIIRHAGH